MLSLSLCLLLISFISSGQSYRAQRWSFPNFNGLDFSSGSPTVVTDSLTGERGTSSICDVNGNYLFYSNGEKVWQANGAIMQGGTGLVGDQNAIQSSIIIPSPLSATRYYLFVVEERSPANPIPEVYFYDVEMTLNGGNGGVVGPTMILDSAVEKIAATRHADDKSYWVVAHKIDSDEFQAFLVDENGVNITPVTSAVGVVHSTIFSADHEGQMKISPDGKWIATCNFSSGNVQLFRFNNATGVVSEPITLASGITNFPYGCEFSADSKKFYFNRSASNASNPVGIHQFDLDHASVDCLLASEVEFSNNNPFRLYADMQLAPDKKIYLSYSYAFAYDSLGTIENPEEVCPSCDYIDQALEVNHSINFGLPNFVSSFLSDGITVEFGTNCENEPTIFFPEDTLNLDSVRWNFGDPLSGSNESTLLQAAHTFSAADTFLVTLDAYRNGVAETFSRKVVIWDVALDILGNDTTLCNGQPVTFDASWNNACLLWSDSSTNNTFTTNQEGTYWVEVSYQSCVWRDSVEVTLVNSPPIVDLGNDTSVCGSVNFTLDPDVPNAFYTWQNGSNDTTFQVTTIGVYWLAASNACGTGSDTLLVEINTDAQPTLNFPQDTTVCENEGFDIDVTFTGATYTWSDGFTGSIRNITNAGVYWVEVANSCDTVSDTFQLNIDVPIVGILPATEVHCGPGDTIKLISDKDSSTVLWSTGITAAVLPITEGGVYGFTQENTCGIFMDSVKIFDWDSNYVIDIGNDTIVCPDAPLLTIGDFEEAYPWVYSWNNEETDALISVEPGIYQLTAEHRCASLLSVINIEEAKPIGINDSLLDTVLCQGEIATISLNAAFADAIKWSTGDDSPELQVTAAGSYFVSITDTNGCEFEDKITFNDFCPGIINAPNIFTPNGDGLNDEYCIELINVVNFRLHIFNRWGIELYFAENESPCWDGQTSGSETSSGTYFYLIEGEDSLGEPFAFRGSFTLID